MKEWLKNDRLACIAKVRVSHDSLISSSIEKHELWSFWAILGQIWTNREFKKQIMLH